MKNSKPFKYLAIGDSIAQGFNSKIGCGTCGFKDKNSYVKGYSYADYLVEFIEDYCKMNAKEKPELLEFWKNFEYQNASISVMRIDDFHSYVNNKFEQGASNIIYMNKKVEEMADIDIQSNLFKINDNLSEEQNFANFSACYIEQIKSADLISVSIGGNEFQSSVPFSLFRSIFKEPNFFEQLKIKEKIFNQLLQIINNIVEQYLLMIRKLKELNPNAKIVLLSYVPPFLTFSMRYEALLKKMNPLVFNDLFKKFVGTLNEVIKQVADQEGCYNVQVFNFDDWKKNSSVLCENTLDVHPTELGYQEMARNIFKLILKNNLIFSDYSENYWKFLNKFSIKRNKLISMRNADNKYVCEMKHGINHIVYILRSWLDSKNNIQNPYFALLKREINNIAEDEKNDALIVSREEYTSLSSLVLERIVFILKYFPKEAETIQLIKNDFVKDENILAVLSKILLSDSIIKIIAISEQVYKQDKSNKLTHFINKLIKANQENFYSLFLEILDNTKDLNNKIHTLIKAICNDFENHKTAIFPERAFTNFVKAMSYNEKLVNDLKSIFIMLESYIVLRHNFNNFDDLILGFIRDNDLLIKQFTRDVLKHLANECKNDRGAFANLILSFIGISPDVLNYREWNKLNNTIDEIWKLLSDEKAIKHITEIIYKLLSEIKIFDNVDFRQFKPLRYMAIVIKRFSRAIGHNLFNKYNRRIIKIVLKLLGIKINNKTRRILK
ncbi:SGNH/GDSL hydrolase family protein [Metamycoplasma neophronis]|uniref:SGNH/GDSL hydrolase family protein n=1 Tax=Metamycoplasma neophronis TaxID=872983 RepID=A0ABY2Z5B6_9BACT|nr:SGNH/GDSL hydrolase family protein [Metamycoplasma neophronis]TPR54698.1 SGNH/GDSL hydrolase family protein [Metamycoplasma neophronis]